jgi:putative NIF3 family GTP cyclohydrolase 1 type 2
MKLSDFYRHIIKFGSLHDPRKRKIAAYPDTAILYGNPDTQVKKVMVGIDIEAPELLLAERIRQREGLDLVIGHHPEGKAFVGLSEVMRLQVDVLVQAGLDRSLAQHMLDERMNEVHRRVMPANHMRPVDVARLLDIPFICMHTPADNHVSHYLEKLFIRRKPKKVADCLELLNQIPEYQTAARELNNGPKVILGSPHRPCGRIHLEMTGGTEGPKEVYEKLSKTDIRTIVCMHLSEEHFKKVKDANLNVIIAGHISSDNLGMNLLLDNLDAASGYELEVINCSGFTRVKRNNHAGKNS